MTGVQTCALPISRKGKTGPHETVERDKAKDQGLPKAIHADEALKILTDLAVLAKKGQITVGEPGGFNTSEITVTPVGVDKPKVDGNQSEKAKKPEA